MYFSFLSPFVLEDMLKEWKGICQANYCAIHFIFLGGYRNKKADMGDNELRRDLYRICHVLFGIQQAKNILNAFSTM